MKLKLNPFRAGWRRAISTALVLNALVSAGAFAADIEIARRWATTPPTINGVIAAGEWTAATATPLIHGQMRTMNDGSYLYVLLDIVDDTVNDPVPTPGVPGDFFSLAFDST